MSAGPLALDDESAIAELRGVLTDAGYRGETLRDALGEERPGGRPDEERPVQRRRLAGQGALGAIATLFAVGDSVQAAEVRKAFAPISPERLRRSDWPSVPGIAFGPACGWSRTTIY